MRRLVCAFVVRKPPKTGFLAARPICNDTFQFVSGLKQHIMTHVKIIDQINNIFAKDKEFSNDFKGDYSLEEIVRGDRDSRATLMPIYGDLYQIKL